MNHKIGVIIHHGLLESLISEDDRKRLESLAEVVYTPLNRPLTVPEAIEILHDCTIALGSWSTPYPTPQLLAGCPHLQLWEHVAGSVKHMFGPHITEHHLTLASCAPANAENVAEMTVAFIIMGMRRLLPFHRRYGIGDAHGGTPLFRKKIGIVGASMTGMHVIRFLQPFKCQVLLYDPYLPAEDAEQIGAEKVDDLTELFHTCEVVSLHTPLTAETRRMITAKHFRALPDGGCFVNTARGGCIDEEALIAELSIGRISAILDVTNPEPPAADSPLWTLDNVLYTPHIAGCAHERLGMQAVDDVAAFVSGGLPAKVFSADMLQTSA